MLGVALVTLVGVLGGVGAWLSSDESESRRLAVIGANQPDGARGDFNGDGFSDVAVGVPGEDLPFSTTTIADAGAVTVVYGSADGLAAEGSSMLHAGELWHQNRGGIEDDIEAGEAFGAAVTAGDFNGDGRSDLAVAVPFEDDGAGAVQVIYGTETGLRFFGNEILRPADFGVTGPLFGDFGAALAWGNFDGDAFADLVVGAPQAPVAGQAGAGAVHVLFGSTHGLDSGRRQTWTQNSVGSIASATAHDNFGGALAPGDFNDDQADDLAVGAPGEDVPGGAANSGQVIVLRGVAGSGLGSTSAQSLRRSTGGRIGAGLAAGDFNGDSKDDLAMGAPLERVRRGDGTTVDRAGIVWVVYGSVVGLHSDRDETPNSQTWHQDSVDEGSEIEDAAELDDGFGRVLAAGDFDGDGSEDLAVAAPGEDIGTIGSAGAINVIYGSATEGLDASGDEVFDQNRSGIDDAAESSDGFGSALAVWNLGKGDEEDLVVGVPNESVTATQAGLAHAIYGDAGSGLTSSGSQLWLQGADGVPDLAEAKDAFGSSLAGG